MIQNVTTLEKAALLSGRSVWETRDLPRHGIRSIFMADGPHGIRRQLGSGGGSSLVHPVRLTTAREALAASPLTVVGHAQGYRRNSPADVSLEAEAAEMAATADVALLWLGLDEASESEGVDRSSLHLPPAQVSLLRAVAARNPNVVVVLSAGGVVDLDWIDETMAVLHGYLAGQAGAEGLVSVLTGETTPSGKLAETYPLSLADTPTAGLFPATNRDAEYREGPFVGYRWYDTARRPVRFPFGFGLSYTTFEYSDLELTPAGVRFTVANTGTLAGAEIAQVYVSRPDSAVLRPEKELKGFAKVHLAPGESARVAVKFDRYTWRHFDTGSGGWITEGGEWIVHVGASSDDLRLSGTVQVEGVAATSPFDVQRMRDALLSGADDEAFETLLGRPLPSSTTGSDLTAESIVSDLARSRSRFARLAHRVLGWLLRRSERRGEANLTLLFIMNMPLRALSKLSGGRVDGAMVAALVDVVNGHGVHGAVGLIRGYLRNRRLNRRTKTLLKGWHRTFEIDFDLNR